MEARKKGLNPRGLKADVAKDEVAMETLIGREMSRLKILKVQQLLFRTKSSKWGSSKWGERK